ncbi:hypothetical protein BDP27DRAFT_1431731 [Rhodocollybia butyracea]|uniref:Uncharacterized protein n=1 Tax=Rhodocollybia butyracea TaxID=206335 RepID=A0A9P5TZ79_9AGAR|nr:hypothetical protein BDP27DRAFT_1431731 [Rhodocollybia butyracea]
MPKFNYLIPINPAGTTIIVFPSLYELGQANILRKSLYRSPEPILPSDPYLNDTIVPTQGGSQDVAVSSASEDNRSTSNDDSLDVDSAIVDGRARALVTADQQTLDFSYPQVPRPRRYQVWHNLCDNYSLISVLRYTKKQRPKASSVHKSSGVIRHAKKQRSKASSPSPCLASSLATTIVSEANEAFATYGCHKVRGKAIWAQWYMYRSREDMLYPPQHPKDLELQDNTLFVHINVAREEQEGPSSLPGYVIVWIWKSIQWQSIQYGDVEKFDNGDCLALSLGGKSGLEPHWILSTSLIKNRCTA